MNKYIQLREQFEKTKDDGYAAKMAAYMRNLFLFYGIPTPKRRAIYREFLKGEKREFQHFVIDYLAAMQKFLIFDDIPRIKKYVKAKQWWDTIDGLAGIIGKIPSDDERLSKLMLEWSVDEDFWVRRIAITHQLHRKEKTNIRLLEKILLNNFGSSEFFINKAIGWSLRDYSKTNPYWVNNFIETSKDKMDKLSIREASKYL
jgi:3-methyladenine DNA glycosylase AlkD